MKYSYNFLHKILKLSFLFTLIFSCSKSKRNLIKVKNDYIVDLTKIDSVRKNIKGYWVLENDIDYPEEEYITCIDFEKSSYQKWSVIKYNKNIFGNTISTLSCQPIPSLMKIKDSICIKFIRMGGQHIEKINFLSKTRMKLDQVVYLKHSGYPEME